MTKFIKVSTILLLTVQVCSGQVEELQLFFNCWSSFWKLAIRTFVGLYINYKPIFTHYLVILELIYCFLKHIHPYFAKLGWEIQILLQIIAQGSHNRMFIGLGHAATIDLLAHPHKLCCLLWFLFQPNCPY